MGRWKSLVISGVRFLSFAFLSTPFVFATFASLIAPPASPAQEAATKPSALRWDPPQVDAPAPSLSANPPCSLPDVLKQSGQRAQELVDHLQNFAAQEQIRYQQTDRPGMAGLSTASGIQQIRSGQTELSFVARFDYVADFGQKFQPLAVRESRKRLAGGDADNLTAILDKGLPVLALIFYPALQGDYEMRCEGSTQWNNRAAWLIHFRQVKGKRPRTLSMETATEVYPRSLTATELRPLSIKGRAWIAADSGQVMHLETNLVNGILAIDLQDIAISVHYGPVKSLSQNMDIWLPQFAVAYTDYAERRMIIEHTFSNFQLFSVKTNEVTRLKGHEQDLEAAKHSAAPDMPAELDSSEPPNVSSGEKETATTPARVSARSGWPPPDIDKDVPALDSAASCDLQEVLQKSGTRIREFVANLEKFAATESLLQETINKSGGVSSTEKRKYDYLFSIQEIRPGVLDVREYLGNGSTPVDTLGGFTTKGLPALVLIFHPYYADTFSMKCEGLATLNGQPAWQVYFRQRPDKPNRLRAYRFGVSGEPHPVALKGRAWFVADTYQILSLQADLVDALPDIQLTVDHTAIEYGPVHFARGVDMWLPQTAELYSDFRGKRIRQRMIYSNYLLFAVDDKQRVSEPKISP